MKKNTDIAITPYDSTVIDSELFRQAFLLFASHHSHTAIRMSSIVLLLSRHVQKGTFDHFYDFIFSGIDWKVAMPLTIKNLSNEHKTKKQK